MSESITDRVEAVRVLGALPAPQGPERQPLSDRRLAEIRNRKLDEVTPGPWLVADGAGGRPVMYVEEPLNGIVGARVLLAAEGASEADVQFVASARRSVPELLAEVDRLRAQLAELKAMRADEHDDLSAAVGYTSGLAWADLVGIAAMNTTSLVQAERDVRALRARVAELEAERRVTNEALDDAVKALRADRIAMVCRECNAPVMWVEGVNDSWWNHTQPAEDGHSIVPRPLVRSSADESADRLTRLLAPSQVLREDADASYVATPETHAQMRAALTRHFSNARTGACENCGSVPEEWCPECAACEQGCFGGFDGNSCSHAKASWGGAR